MIEEADLRSRLKRLKSAAEQSILIPPFWGTVMLAHGVGVKIDYVSIKVQRASTLHTQVPDA